MADQERRTKRTMKIYQFIVAAVLVFAALAVAQETTRSDAFITADADSDGTLSEDEIGAAMNALGLRSPETKAELASLMNRMDYDVDGKVSKDEFISTLTKSDSALGKFGVIATRFVDNVGLLPLVNKFGAAVGINPGNQALDLLVFSIITSLYVFLVFFGVRVSYFEKHAQYYAGFAATMFMWLFVFTAIDFNTEYPAGFTVLSFLGGLVGTADYFMEGYDPKKNAAHGRSNAAKMAKRRKGIR